MLNGLIFLAAVVAVLGCAIVFAIEDDPARDCADRRPPAEDLAGHPAPLKVVQGGAGRVLDVRGAVFPAQPSATDPVPLRPPLRLVKPDPVVDLGKRDLHRPRRGA